MTYSELRSYFHHHCRIRLRSGKEVFGVLWDNMDQADRAIYFASNIEHRKLMDKSLESQRNDLIRIQFEDIIGVEPVGGFQVN